MKRARSLLTACGLAVILVTQTMAQDNAAISRDDVDAWLRAYEQAWEGKDPDAAAKLFAANARYHETPYAEPFEGPAGVRDYWARVTADQRDIRFDYAIVAVTGNTGIATWSAKFNTISSGAAVELNGVFLLDFDADKRCTRLREWWHVR
ncbi:MAG TPA: nuclear transport factor 2 family protein [Gammaproteobacteria bacterium]